MVGEDLLQIQSFAEEHGGSNSIFMITTVNYKLNDSHYTFALVIKQLLTGCRMANGPTPCCNEGEYVGAEGFAL